MRILVMLLALALPAMAGRDFWTDKHILGRLAYPISTPITVHIVAYPSNNTQTFCVLNVGTDTNAQERIQFNFDGAAAGDPIKVFSVNASGSFPVASGGTFTALAWNYAAAVVESDARRVAYLNGSPVATNTTSAVVDGVDVVRIGVARFTGGLTQFFNGQLAEVAIWDVALADSEIASLSLGIAPFMVRPASLVFYAPLTGRDASTEWYYVGSSLTLSNSPTVSLDHPRIYRP